MQFQGCKKLPSKNKFVDAIAVADAIAFAPEAFAFYQAHMGREGEGTHSQYTIALFIPFLMRRSIADSEDLCS